MTRRRSPTEEMRVEAAREAARQVMQERQSSRFERILDRLLDPKTLGTLAAAGLLGNVGQAALNAGAVSQGQVEAKVADLSAAYADHIASLKAEIIRLADERNLAWSRYRECREAMP